MEWLHQIWQNLLNGAESTIKQAKNISEMNTRGWDLHEFYECHKN